MTSTYIVYIRNKTPYNNQYLFFNSKPTDSTTLGVVWSNVWVKTGGTPTPNGQQKFTVTMDNFAVCGTSEIPLGDGVSVSMSDWTQVSLANQTTPGTRAVMDVVNENPAFVKPFGTESLGNSFGIKTGVYDPNQYPNIYCAYGKRDSKGTVVPVLSWQARSNSTYKVTPIVTFYISTGEYKPGETVDITTLGAIATIDFTTALPGQTVATVTHRVDSTYSDPVFDYPTKKELRGEDRDLLLH
jgi:hypothetical protein